jgi:cell division ATPase FtsA
MKIRWMCLLLLRRKITLIHLLRIYKSMGLRPVAFEVESAACARALISSEMKTRNTLILDMDTYRTSLIVIEKGNLQFTSSVPIAGDAFHPEHRPGTERQRGRGGEY